MLFVLGWFSAYVSSVFKITYNELSVEWNVKPYHTISYHRSLGALPWSKMSYWDTTAAFTIFCSIYGVLMVQLLLASLRLRYVLIANVGLYIICPLRISGWIDQLSRLTIFFTSLEHWTAIPSFVGLAFNVGEHWKRWERCETENARNETHGVQLHSN